MKVFSMLLILIVTTSLYALEIYRPENFGDMNDIPCYLRITDMDGNDATDCIKGISHSWYYDVRLLHRYYEGCLTGGSVVHLSMKEGTYKIYVYTPKDKQSEYDDLTGDWKSNEFIYKVGSPALNVIFISPTADDNGFYNGGWHVDYKAPKYFKYTKPYLN